MPTTVYSSCSLPCCSSGSSSSSSSSSKSGSGGSSSSTSLRCGVNFAPGCGFDPHQYMLDTTGTALTNGTCAGCAAASGTFTLCRDDVCTPVGQDLSTCCFYGPAMNVCPAGQMWQWQLCLLGPLLGVWTYKLSLVGVTTGITAFLYEGTANNCNGCSNFVLNATNLFICNLPGRPAWTLTVI